MNPSRLAPYPIFRGSGQIDFVDRRIPEPAEGELLLQVRANAICGSDRDQFFNGSDVVPGHEAVGVVAEAGLGTSTPIGTMGAVYLMEFCGRCRSCSQGFTNQCIDKRADMGFSKDGGYGPYELIREAIFFPLEDGTTAVDGTLLLDVMGTSGHALRRARKMRSDIESIYIAGAGPIGLGLLVMTRLMLGDSVQIHISDVSEWRRDYALRLGGVPIDPARDLALDAVPQADLAFDSTGKEVARRAALGRLGPRGVLVCVGHGETITVDVSKQLIAPERAILGSEYFQLAEMAENYALLQSNRQALSSVITHTFPVANISDAFAAFLAGTTGKVVVTQEPV